ncbi:MAG TPA: 2Fe-2S iron-sulfur cluster-binding protein [Candidatus Dormibacteraeota bacterium]
MPETPPTVTLTIDGIEVTVPKGTLVVEAAKRIGIEIPVFCYHHKLDPVGACRLCLVEMSPGPPRPQTACTTPVADGMVVKTASPMAVAGRADILEFELVNHPLDCPVCDKGGECPLQDYTFRHAFPVSRVSDPRLHFPKPIPLSDKIALDRERCVLCYRCTRYYDEIAWEQELTTDQRGAQSFITSQFDRPLESIFSGNIIDLCPVGALTSRVWRFESRPWDMNHTESICSKCSVGCSVTLWERRRQLVRVTSHENDEIDDGWICDRGRFDYTHVNDPARLRVPQVEGRAASWEEAITRTVEALRGKKRRLGISVAQDATNEELYLLRKLLDGPLAGARVALERRTLLPQPGPTDTLAIDDLDRARAIVVIASDTRDDVPIINLRIKKAVSKGGAKLVLVHPDELDLDRHRDTVHVRSTWADMPKAIAGLRRHEALREGPVAILYGDGRGAGDAAVIVAAARDLATSLKAASMPLYRATNERGALNLGLAVEPDDLAGVDTCLSWGPPAVPVPKSAKTVISWDSLPRAELQSAQVVLPDLTFAETQGSYTNVEGRVQFLRPVLLVSDPMREGWDVLCELARGLGLDLDFLGVYGVQRAAAQAFPAELAALADPPAPAAGLRNPTVQGPARP